MLTVEERLEKLEREVQELKLLRATDGDARSRKSNWISKISGSFKDDAEFDEILRLGHEERKADVINGE